MVKESKNRETIDARRSDHAEAAREISDAAASHVRYARDLGWAASRMGLSHTDNPFEKLMNSELKSAWASGWVMGNEGINLNG
jgi:hypothetical protein